MVHVQSAGAITNGFSYPTLPKRPVKPSYGSIRDTHCFLTANTASIKSPRCRGQNGHLGLVLMTTQYSLVSQVPSVRLTDPSRTPNIPAWKNPSEDKALLCKHAKQRQQYDEYRNVDAALRNQLLKALGYTYLSPLKNAFMGYSRATTLQLLSQLYAHYVRISATDLSNNDKKLGEAYNTDDPLESLYTRLNECVDYTTAAGDLITEGQFVRIAYGLVAEMAQFQED